MMDVPGCCCGRRPCRCNNGLNDICQGVNCILGGVAKTICCGVNMLGSCSMAQPCCPPPRPCQPCCRPRPHPPTCNCRCVCKCVCDNRRCC